MKKEKQFKWLFGLTQGSRTLIFLLVFVAAFGAVASVFIAYLLRGFVDMATGYIDTPFAVYLKLTVIALAVLGFLYISGIMLKAYIFAGIEGRLREKLLGMIMSKKLAEVQKVHTGEMLVLLSDDTAEVSGFFPNLVDGIFKNIVLVVGSVIVMFVFSWQIALIILITLPVMMVALNLFMPLIQKRSLALKEAEEANRKHMQETVSKVLLFKVYSMAPKALMMQNTLYARKKGSQVRLAALEGTSGFLNMLFSIATFLIILGIGALFVLRGETTVGSLVAMLNLMGNITNPLGEVSGYISQIAQAKASAERIRKLTELPCDNEPILRGEQKLGIVRGKNLSYAYDNGDIFKNVNFEAKPNEIIGIIGDSGSGKSTLTKLLMGLYEPKSGSVEYLSEQGNPIKNMLPYISYVPSDNFLFGGSIADNICMGEEVNPELMEIAAKEANIYEFVRSLPDGYGETIGEGSNSLSSGQAQRIGIARALYKDSPVIVFDEPTSNLNAESIEALHGTIQKVSHGKICIIVTHDASTKGICDKVYRMENGELKLEK